MGPAGPQGPAGVGLDKAHLHVIGATTTTASCESAQDVMVDCTCYAMAIGMLGSPSQLGLTGAGVAVRHFSAADRCACPSPTQPTFGELLPYTITTCASQSAACGGALPANYGDACQTGCTLGVVGCDGQCSGFVVGTASNAGTACTTSDGTSGTIACDGTCQPPFSLPPGPVWF